MNNQDEFKFHPQSNAPGHQLVTAKIDSFLLQAIAGLIIKLGKIADDEFPEGSEDYGTGAYLREMGTEFGQQVLSQSQYADAIDTDKHISFTVPVEYVSSICKVLRQGLGMGKVSAEMHMAWTPFAIKAIKHIPGGEAMLRKALFRDANPDHPGFRADLN